MRNVLTRKHFILLGAIFLISIHSGYCSSKGKAAPTTRPKPTTTTVKTKATTPKTATPLTTTTLPTKTTTPTTTPTTTTTTTATTTTTTTTPTPNTTSTTTSSSISTAISPNSTSPAKENSTDANNTIDFDLDPFTVKEDGCPIVLERHNLNLKKLAGDWKLPYTSLNWLAEMSIALMNRSAKKSEMLSHCPTIIVNKTVDSHPKNASSNITFSTTWKCPKSKHEFKIECWPQTEKSVSKFMCWNDKEMRLMYLMLVATDHKGWFVLVRCSPSEGVAKPAEGMSWAILSKTTKLNPDVAKVIFSLLEGYGFDIEAFKSALPYSDC